MDKPPLDLMSMMTSANLEEIEAALRALKGTPGLPNAYARGADYLGRHPLDRDEPIADNHIAFYSHLFVSGRHVRHIFLARSDWSQIAVPITLDVDESELILDDSIRRWAWWKGRWASEVVDEASARRVAHKIMEYHLGEKWEPAKRYQRFELATGKNKHTFRTTRDWKGLWVPCYMADENTKFDNQTRLFGRVAKPEDVQGKRAVRAMARALAQSFDKIKASTKKTRVDRNHCNFYLCDDVRAKYDCVHAYLNERRRHTVNLSQAIQYCIEVAYDALPPDEQRADEYENDKGQIIPIPTERKPRRRRPDGQAEGGRGKGE